MAQPELLEIAVDAGGVEAVRAAWHPPSGAGRASAILLAHGAGFGHDSPWMAELARALAARGFPVLAFDYPYRERARRAGKQRAPDRAPVLEAAHERALDALRERAPGKRVLLAGKSLGGRIASHLAAKDVPCAGLVFFGYPLHPPGRAERLRSEHFAAIVQPALFLQGTRDDLCRLDLLRDALRPFGGNATVHVVAGADHSFRVRGRSEEEVRAELAERTARWDEQAFPE